MSVKRLAEIPGFNIDRVAAAAGDDPEVLRMENLDTDLPPPPGVIEATREAVGLDEANSWLPFTGKDEMKQAIVEHVKRRSGVNYEALSEVTVTCGEGDAMLDSLLASTDLGDEVIVTDPTYAGMINRVRLAGAVPRLVPLRPADEGWRLDLSALRAAASDRTKAVFVMNPSLPTGCVLEPEEWEAIAAVCRDQDAWLLYCSIYEGIVFDGRPIIHPASLEGMRDRTITMGSVSLEYRMIGWRVGWVVAPLSIASDIGLVSIYNGLVPGGIGQAGARVALESPTEDFTSAVAEYQRRRDVTMEQLAPYSPVPAAGGWSFLVDVTRLGLYGAEASRRLLEQKVAATPMKGWGGGVAERYVRFVFSNEPVERLERLGERARVALAPS
jgi:aspartate/methionine/tyrosine aminotransferase